MISETGITMIEMNVEENNETMTTSSAGLPVRIVSNENSTTETSGGISYYYNSDLIMIIIIIISVMVNGYGCF